MKVSHRGKQNPEFSVDRPAQAGRTAARQTDLGERCDARDLDGGDGLPRAVAVEEACGLLGVSRSTLYGLLRTCRIRSVKAGRRRLIPLATLAEFLRSGDRSDD